MNNSIELQAQKVQSHTPAISNVQVRIVECGTDGLVAWASCVIAGSIRLDNIAVRRGRDGQLFLTYPAKRTPRGDKTHYFNPITTTAAQAVQDALLARLALLAKPPVSASKTGVRA